MAEELAKQLELQSSESRTNGSADNETEGSILEEAFEPPSDMGQVKKIGGVQSESESAQIKEVDTKLISNSTTMLEQRLETMLVDMQELREQMESFKHRAETAESERDLDRKTLAEMVEKIRSEESTRKLSSTERSQPPAAHPAVSQDLLNSNMEEPHTLAPFLQKAGLTNGNVVSPAEEGRSGRPVAGTLSRPGHGPLLYHTTPYASMVGIVLIGMGLMAYLNGWQPPKVDQ